MKIENRKLHVKLGPVGTHTYDGLPPSISFPTFIFS